MRHSTRSGGACRRAAFRRVLLAIALAWAWAQPSAAQTRGASARGDVPAALLLRIVRAEDERRWDESDLGRLLEDERPSVRRRAALAAGRIGDAGAVAALSARLRSDIDEGVRAAAAFSLGEIESESGADALLGALRAEQPAAVRARAVEALGKIASALPEARAGLRRQVGEALIGALSAEQKSVRPDRLTELLALTALLRARPEGAARAVAASLDSPDPRVRADAANALARLRAKEAQARLRGMLAGDTDALARANAARALGAAEDAAAFDTLLAHALKDGDTRVRVSAVRSLAQLKDVRAGAQLVGRGRELLAAYRSEKSSGAAHPSAANELLEVAAAIGRLLSGTDQDGAVSLLREARSAGLYAPEVEAALARISPDGYVRDAELKDLVARIARPVGGPAGTVSWQRVSASAQGLGELAGQDGGQARGRDDTRAAAQAVLRDLLAGAGTPTLAEPELLRALAAFKPPDLAAVARVRLAAEDVVVRATAADILGELPPDEGNARALEAALPRALRDSLNDAALSILGALARQWGETALRAARSALGAPDYLVRRRASEIAREAGGGGGARPSVRVNTRNLESDYRRALARIGLEVLARVETEKGSFTLALLPEDAPLTVDNFVRLARRRYFDGVTFHRVVPNFVVQGGDPRGDGSGGPGYQIRCEINTVAYDRGAVGMALSGKDTGGSQWFVTHSPQPHLDGGYTVFGRVVAGMEVVDRIARGDRIRSVTVTERRAGRGREGGVR